VRAGAVELALTECSSDRSARAHLGKLPGKAAGVTSSSAALPSSLKQSWGAGTELRERVAGPHGGRGGWGGGGHTLVRGEEKLATQAKQGERESPRVEPVNPKQRTGFGSTVVRDFSENDDENYSEEVRVSYIASMLETRRTNHPNEK